MTSFFPGRHRLPKHARPATRSFLSLALPLAGARGG